MTVSLADHRHPVIAAFLVAAAVSCSSFGALAQITAPVTPDTQAQQPQAQPDPVDQAPIRLGPRRLITSPDPEPVSPDPTVPSRPDSVDLQALDSVDADSVGTLDEASGGFGTNMWDGSDRALVVRLLALLPREIASPAMRDLARRLLLTRATAPKRTAPGPGLLPLRARSLLAMGDHAGALALIQVVPPAAAEEQLLFTEVESRFLGQDTQGACSVVQGAASELKGRYWQQALAFCLSIAGKNAEAILISDILAERSKNVDPAFFAAMDTLAGATPPRLKSLKDPSALLLTMLRTAGIKIPEAGVSSDVPAIAAAVATSPNAPLSVRLPAGEKAARFGALTSRQLTEIYRAEKFDKAMIANAITSAETEWGPRGRALLVQATIGQAVPAARAEALQRAIQLARLDGDISLTAHALLQHLRNIRPAPELIWFADDVTRALIAGGAWQEAQNWLRMTGRQVRRPEDPDLSHLSALAGVLPPTVPLADRLRGWWEQQQAQHGDNAAERGRVLFSLLSALGVTVPGSLWAAVIDEASVKTGPVPPAGIRALLADAATARRVGETVVISLLMLGSKGPAPENLHASEDVISALRAVGLMDEARQIAVEAAVASGL